MNIFLEIQPITLISSILFVIYLARVANHISIRSSYYIAPIIIFPFLTSIYKTTFFSFLLNPSIEDFSLVGLKNILYFWLNGSKESLILIGILFIAEKVSLTSLSPAILFELLIIAIAINAILIKFVGFYLIWPLFLGILFPILIHFFLSKDLKFKNLNGIFTLNIKKIIIYIRKNQSLVLGFFYLLSTYLNAQSELNVNLISESHVIRIVIFWILFYILYGLFDSLNKRVLIRFTPIIFMYTMFSINTSIGSNISNLGIYSPYGFNCLSSIALLPLVEFIFMQYRKSKIRIKYRKHVHFIKKFSLLAKIFLLGLSACYCTYIFNAQ